MQLKTSPSLPYNVHVHQINTCDSVATLQASCVMWLDFSHYVLTPLSILQAAQYLYKVTAECKLCLCDSTVYHFRLTKIHLQAKHSATAIDDR